MYVKYKFSRALIKNVTMAYEYNTPLDMGLIFIKFIALFKR